MNLDESHLSMTEREEKEALWPMTGEFDEGWDLFSIQMHNLYQVQKHCSLKSHCGIWRRPNKLSLRTLPMKALLGISWRTPTLVLGGFLYLTTAFSAPKVQGRGREPNHVNDFLKATSKYELQLPDVIYICCASKTEGLNGSYMFSPGQFCWTLPWVSGSLSCLLCYCPLCPQLNFRVINLVPRKFYQMTSL